MTAKQYLDKAGIFSTHVAMASFVIGTIILLVYRCVPNVANIAFITGFFYVIAAFLVNGIVFIYLLYGFIVRPILREYFAVKMLIMLANIPILILYFFLITINFNL